MTNSYKEQCVLHKEVRRGVREAHPVNVNATDRPKDWLVILLEPQYLPTTKGHGPLRMYVWGEYRDEPTAAKAMEKSMVRVYGVTRVYYCHRGVFDTMKPLWESDAVQSAVPLSGCTV
jgi:hypothetical protein